MTDQRFRYYTGYEVDNEPSDDDDEEEVNATHKAITQGPGSSDSSDDEFDQPIRDYIEKTMSQPSKSAASNTFANEMEDELNQIYHNFISRGTFELPISTQKSVSEKKAALEKEEESDSDNEKNSTDLPATTLDDPEKNNDELLYDPDEEDEDEKWMTNERIRSRGAQPAASDSSAIGPTDAVLNCPGCMVLLSHDCQRHETNKNQYRAMFVFNCTIDENRLASASVSNAQKSAKKQNKRFKSEEEKPAEEILRPVLCSECGTEVGVYEPKEELYHFANVLTSH